MGNQANAEIAATNAKIIATVMATSIPEMNAERAPLAMASPIEPPTCWATSRPPPIDLRAKLAELAGTFWAASDAAR